MKARAVKVDFGRVALLRMVCPKCGLMGLVLSGKMLCCGKDIKNPERYQRKREAEGEHRRSLLSKKEKDSILESQGNCCVYCQRPFGTPVWHPKRQRVFIPDIHFDHFVCWNFSRNTSVGNMVAACSICNIIKGDKLFENIEQARAFIVYKRNKKGYEDEMSPSMSNDIKERPPSAIPCQVAGSPVEKGSDVRENGLPDPPLGKNGAESGPIAQISTPEQLRGTNAKIDTDSNRDGRIE
jgi:hypothetical protein